MFIPLFTDIRGCLKEPGYQLRVVAELWEVTARLANFGKIGEPRNRAMQSKTDYRFEKASKLLEMSSESQPVQPLPQTEPEALALHRNIGLGFRV